MTFIDFHSHHPAIKDEIVIQDGTDTWGIHPWTLHEPPLPQPEDILAVGECGLDKVCDTPWDEQLAAFERCIRLSEEWHKPLYIHCVRAQSECLQQRIQFRATQPWIWHGFRGSSAAMQQILQHNGHVCFGFRHREDAVRECPMERMLLESDENRDSIEDLYHHIAALRGISTETLCRAMRENYLRLFGAIEN